MVNYDKNGKLDSNVIKLTQPYIGFWPFLLVKHKLLNLLSGNIWLPVCSHHLHGCGSRTEDYVVFYEYDYSLLTFDIYYSIQFLMILHLQLINFALVINPLMGGANKSHPWVEAFQIDNYKNIQRLSSTSNQASFNTVYLVRSMSCKHVELVYQHTSSHTHDNYGKTLPGMLVISCLFLQVIPVSVEVTIEAVTATQMNRSGRNDQHTIIILSLVLICACISYNSSLKHDIQRKVSML